MVSATEKRTPGSAGRQPAPFGSLPNGWEIFRRVPASNVCGRLPQTGWQPALPRIL